MISCQKKEIFMAAHFYVYSGVWPLESSCGFESLQEGLDTAPPVGLNSLRPDHMEYTESQLQTHRDRLEPTQETEGYWRQRTVVEAMSCLQLQHLSFIPHDPHVSNILYLKRGQPSEDLAQSLLYPFHLSRYRFLLAVKSANRVFSLAQTPFQSTLKEIERDQAAALEKVLNCFLNDKKSAGIALTILEKTYIWLK